MQPEDRIKQLEAELKDLQEQFSLYKRVMKQLPDNVWVIEANGTFFMSNHNIDKVTSVFLNKEIPEDSRYKYNWYDEISALSVPAPYLEILRKNDAITIKSGRMMLFEETVTIGDKVRTYLSHKKPYVDPVNQKTYLVGISVDITGAKKEEEEMKRFIHEMKEMSQAKQDFMQNFRHDLLTPISNIMGAVDLITHSPGKPDIQFFTESIQASVLKLKDYVDQLEDVIVSEKKPQSIIIEQVRIHELLQNIVSSFYVLAKNKKLKLSLNIADNLPESIKSDQARLTRIISNLVSNAIKYSEEGSVDVDVFYTATDEGSLLEVHVIDTGVGIDTTQHKAIFSPLVRVPQAGDNTVEGQGLGLSIVKSFVDDLRGQVSVNSSIGSGSQFVVMIPVDMPAGS